MADLDDLIRQATLDEPSQERALGLQPRICEALMLAHYDFVYHLAYSFLGDADDADDAAQETFLQAALHMDQYHLGTSLKNWLARIAVNTCRMKYRKQKSRQRLEQVLKIASLQRFFPSEPSPEESLLRSEKQRKLKDAVDSLDEKHRLPVLLRYVHGLSVPEIAHVLDEKEGTIHSRLHYAHHKLRGRLASLADNPLHNPAGNQ